MTYARITAILGFVVLIISYSGLPGSWKSLISTLCGLALMYAGYRLYKLFEVKKLEGGEQQTKTYAETSNQTPTVAQPESTPHIPNI